VNGLGIYFFAGASFASERYIDVRRNGFLEQFEGFFNGFTLTNNAVFEAVLGF
jgi:hypothetical protein